MQLTGEGLIYEVTASGGYEDCIGMLADELADLVDEPFVRLVIRMKRGRRRQRISKARIHAARLAGVNTSYHPRHERGVCGDSGARLPLRIHARAPGRYSGYSFGDQKPGRAGNARRGAASKPTSGA